MFREMRRIRQQTDTAECERILETAKRGVLSVNGDGGYPYGVPMNFVYADGKIYFHSAVCGHKLDAINADDKVSFCVLSDGVKEPDDWWYHFTSVIVFGRIRVIEDENARIGAFRKLGLKYFPTAEMVESDIKKNAARALILELTIEHMTGKRVREN